MKDLTVIEVERIRQGLEETSATILGKMLFVLSRLDMNLGLLLVWKDDEKELEKLNSEIGSFTFQKKLSFLSKLAEKKYGNNKEANSLYTEWLNDADRIREIRNE